MPSGAFVEKARSFRLVKPAACPPLFCLPPPRWSSDDWEHCTKTCGSLGFQIRTVRCVQCLSDGTNRSVHSKYCSGEKPESRRPCGRVSCPAQWRTGAWSEVGCPCCSRGREGRLFIMKGSLGDGSMRLILRLLGSN